jgi:predicted MPP superfamily phosphohydrolase
VIKQDLTWIHLSDLHLEEVDRYKRKELLAALWKDIKNFQNNGITPNFIAFTGDITYHGIKEEYDYALKDFFEPLMKVCKIQSKNIFISPGNHDSNWNAVGKLDNPIPQLIDGKEIDAFIQQITNKDKYLTPFQDCREFLCSFSPAYQNQDNPVFGSVHSVNIGGLNVSILCLNSAWLSGYNLDLHGEVDDYGKLALSGYQIINAQLKNGKSDLQIVLLHHPWDWLLEDDKSNSINRLSRSCNIILRGHLHKQNAMLESNLSGDNLVITAGALYSNSKYPNAYNYVHLDLLNGVGTVYFRRYSSDKNEWQKDIVSTGEDNDGQFAFDLPKLWFSTTVILDGGNASVNIKDYSFVFKEDCKKILKKLDLDENDIINIIEGVFRKHINYCDYDMNDYSLPVQLGTDNYIIVLDKIFKTLTIHRLIRCTDNHAKITSWENILAPYRRATRLSYREDPQKLLLERGMVKRATILHSEIRNRIKKHFEEFEDIQVNPISRRAIKEYSIAHDQPFPNIITHLEKMGDEISYHIEESNMSSKEIYDIVELYDCGDLTIDDTIALLITELERSLQHIHNIIRNYPPTD